MKKIDKEKHLRLQLKRERKTLKRRKANKHFLDKTVAESKEISFKKAIDSKLLRNFKFELNDFLDERGNQPEDELSKIIRIPSVFSLEENYNETILTLSLLRKSLFKFLGSSFEIDFTNCEKADFSGLFNFKVILDECIKELKRLHQNLLYYAATPNIKILHSKYEPVNLMLLANAIIPKTEHKSSQFLPISILNLITGRKNQKHYAENKKGSAATGIRNYINNGLRRHNVELNPQGVGYMDGLISEILNNAEDHSLFDKWYAFANLFETKRTNHSAEELVGEINLAFLNFGNSIFEGFEETKIDNYILYNEMNDLYCAVALTSKGSKFTKENLFTLYALQEGYSRLKYKEESRGTGTMKFINSFLSLGDYENSEKGYTPHLLIYSGSTMLKCDNKYRPFKINSTFYLSLNDEKDLSIAPEKSHLKSLKYRFPGTLLIGKIYLNESHLKRKVVENGK